MENALKLRTRLVDDLRDEGWITTAPVEDAMRTVPRHLFLPEEDLATAYADQNVATITGPDGECLSSASTPSIVAMMLEQLDVRPGNRVLEIGAGTGYNAALLTHLGAQVTTIDIDPSAVANTRKSLERAGITAVNLVEGDGELGVAEHAPYDRIILTAGSWDITPAWWEQLSDGGLLIIPLRFRGNTRSIAFQRREQQLISRSVKLCGFIPMRNDHGEHEIDLGGGVTLLCDDDQGIHTADLSLVLDEPKRTSWSGTEVGTEPIHGIWGRLAVEEAGTCRIAARPEAVTSGRATPVIPMLSPALVQDRSVAYLAHRPLAVKGRSELGAIGHGPAADQLCARLVDHIRTWGQDRTDPLSITARPAHSGTHDESSDRVIKKRNIELCLRLTR